MAKYKWSFANVGGVTRVRIQSAEDIRHLGELDILDDVEPSVVDQGLEHLHADFQALRSTSHVVTVVVCRRGIYEEITCFDAAGRDDAGGIGTDQEGFHPGRCIFHLSRVQS